MRPSLEKLTCGHSGTYGTDSKGRTFCDECCASRDIGAMLKDGHSKRLPLYLDEKGREVTNWPGSLRFPIPVSINKGKHNIAGIRRDFCFIGPDSYWWHGVCYGDNTQIAHCKRTKARCPYA